MQYPQISILVPICNVQHYLRQCLASLANQTLESLEIICINDGSTDDSLRIINEFAARDDRFVVIDKPNSGYGDSMNRGLNVSRGQYVGIVESDDYASPDMFERLYRLALDSDADLVRSNLFEHSTVDGVEVDIYSENLIGCPYDKVVKPIEHPKTFLCRPAIWTCLYKKTFLIDNNIEFLPTPGASFQDTSFCFKALYAADRVLFTRDAFLHYRVDNANSSVKSQKKIFPICDEYEEIWRYAKLYEERFSEIKLVIPRQQFGGYKWNLDRLVPKYQPLFYERFAREFKSIWNAGLIKEEQFGHDDYSFARRLAESPDELFVSCYGPVNISSSHILLAYGQPSYVVRSACDAILSSSTGDEEFFLLHESSDTIVEDLRASNLAGAKSVFTDSDLFISHFSLELDSVAVRGEVVSATILDATACKEIISSGKLGSRAALARNSMSIPLSEIDKTRELSLSLPVLLFESGGIESKRLESAVWRLCANKPFPGSLSSSEFDCLAKRLVDEANRRCSTSESVDAKLEKLSGIEPLWSRCRAAFNSLSFTQRESSRPVFAAMEQVYVIACTGSSDAVQPQISVIIPVFNAENYLSECLDSVFSQEEISLEVIAVVDGSQDASLQMLRDAAQNDNRLHVYYQPNLGVSAARNRGISLARGEYLAFIDPDDFYASRYSLYSLHDAAVKHSCDMCGGGFSVYESGRHISETFAYNESHYYSRSEKIVNEKDVFNDYGWIRFLYKRSLFSDGTLTFPRRVFYEDPVFFTRAISKAGSYYVIPDVVYRYRVGFKRYRWKSAAVRDILRGISENMRYAEGIDNSALYSMLVQRINYDYYDAIMGCIDDEEVLCLLASIQAGLNASLFNEAVDKELAFSVLRPLADLARIGKPADCQSQEASRATAVVRFASKIERSKAYTGMQSFIWRLKDAIWGSGR